MDQKKLNDIFSFNVKLFFIIFLQQYEKKKEISDSKIFLAQGDFNYKFIYNFIIQVKLF